MAVYMFLKDSYHRVHFIFPVSDVYRNQKLAGYDLLEEGNRDIVRRLNPCPKAYKKYVDTSTK